MALTPIRRPLPVARPVASVSTAVAGRNPINDQPAVKEEGETKTVSVRFPPSHHALLEEVKAIAECDKSEAVKRGLRLLHNALTSRDAMLHLTDGNGNKTVIPIMRNGRPA